MSSVQRAGRRRVGELAHGIRDPAPGRGAIVIVACGTFVSSGRAFVECLLAAALQHQGGGATDFDLRYHAGEIRTLVFEKRLTPIIARFARLRVKGGDRWQRY
jgi:hypothetical protein